MTANSIKKTAQTWIIYALGGGWGHLTRALSLGRVAASNKLAETGTSRKVKIITNSPYLPYLQIKDLSCVEFLAIAPDASFQITCDRVRQILLNSNYDGAIVDTFPRGLGGELADILPQLSHVPKILIHRDLCPEYVLAKDLRSFVDRYFDLVIVPGEGEDIPLADLSMVRHTGPWLIRQAEELDLNQARQLLKITTTSQNLTPHCGKNILVYSSGKPSELALFGAIAHSLSLAFPESTVRCLAPMLPPGCPPDLWVSHWPGIECLRAADIVVGSGGYNTVSECRALGIPLVAFAFKRLYDRQFRRLSVASYGIEIVADKNLTNYVATTIAAVRSLLRQKPRSTIPHYENGAVTAWQIIEREVLLRSPSSPTSC